MKNAELTNGLAILLANTYTLYLKTQNYHWHVTGPHFHSLHIMFEGEYNALALTVDEIAERLRSMGQNAPATFAEFLKLATVKEEMGTPIANDMVKKLLHDHEIIIKQIADLLPLAQAVKDEATFDLLIKRTEAHEKTAWMLRSSIG